MSTFGGPLIGDRMFATALYRAWKHELRAHSYPSLIEVIDKEINGSPKTHFAALILRLREDLKAHHPAAPVTAHWLYHQRLAPFIANLFFPPYQSLESKEDLQRLWSTISATRGLDGSFMSNQDNVLMGNVPFLLWEEDSVGFKTRFFRTPNPFIFTGGLPQLSPEYRALLSSLEEGERCFYVNTMTRDIQNPLEYNLSSALHDFESDHENLYPFTVDRNSREYEPSSPRLFADTHKTFFIDKLFTSDSLFQWPFKYDRELGYRQIKSIVEFVHLKFFNNKTSFSSEERKCFNEICIVYLILKMIEVIKPSICHISCYVSVDRGPSLFTLLYVLLRHRAHQAYGKDFYRNVATFLLGPSLAFCDRAIHLHRFDTFISCMSLILASPFEMPRELPEDPAEEPQSEHTADFFPEEDQELISLTSSSPTTSSNISLAD